MDPVTGTIYHLKNFPPETDEISARLIIRADDNPEKVLPNFMFSSNFHYGNLTLFPWQKTLVIGQFYNLQQRNVLNNIDVNGDVTRHFSSQCFIKFHYLCSDFSCMTLHWILQFSSKSFCVKTVTLFYLFYHIGTRTFNISWFMVCYQVLLFDINRLSHVLKRIRGMQMLSCLPTWTY